MALSLTSMIELCRVLRHYLGAGLTAVDVFRKQATDGNASVRPVAARIAADLEDGTSVGDALEKEAASFPPLFLSLAKVGDQTGMLPEVCADLEKFFLKQRELWRRFLAQIAWPVFQFTLATLVLAGLIWFLGELPINAKGAAYDPLGLGLIGGTGAAIFFSGVWGTIAAAWLAQFLIRRSLAGRAWADRALLAVPALGPCLRALALARFCLALRLTTESGMSIGKALRLSLRATGNAAFADAAKQASATVKRGDEVHAALAGANVFPDDFLHILSVAEESGTIAEVMKHQGEHYTDEAGRRMTTLTMVAGGAIWLAVGFAIIVAIVRLYGSYLGQIDDAMKGMGL
ncbi:MAG: type II secretion system F family protein [Gemmataceae bacterium]